MPTLREYLDGFHDFEEDEIVPDGASVRVPLIMKDEAKDENADDAARERAWDEMRQRISDAYKNPEAMQPVQPQPQPQLHDAADPRERAWLEMTDRLSNAWRQP